MNLYFVDNCLTIAEDEIQVRKIGVGFQIVVRRKLSGIEKLRCSGTRIFSQK